MRRDCDAIAMCLKRDHNAIATRLLAIATRLLAIATRLPTIAKRLKRDHNAIATRLPRDYDATANDCQAIAK
jgi:hypothetical protein